MTFWQLFGESILWCLLLGLVWGLLSKGPTRTEIEKLREKNRVLDRERKARRDAVLADYARRRRID